MTDATLFEEAAQAFSKGDLDAAERGFRALLCKVPTHAPSLNGLGAVACGRGRIEEGLTLFRRAVALDPEIAEYQGNLGRALMQANRLEEAAQIVARAVALDETQWTLHRDLGAILARLRRHEAAAAAYRRAAALRPRDAATHRALGSALAACGRLTQAEACLRRALALRRDDAGIWSELGSVLRQAGRLEEAEEALRRGLALRPEDAQALNNLGTVLMALNRLAEAVAVMRQAIACAPDLAAAHYNLGLALLLDGRIGEGLPEYEWRLAVKGAAPPLPGIPSWCGEAVEGRTVFVWAEQGVGDQIMFAGLLPDLLAAGARAVVQADPRLLPLFGRSFPSILFVPRGVEVAIAESDRPDLQIALGSLCRWLRPGLDRFPAHNGYLRADAAATERLRERYRARVAGRRLVGLSWRGGSRGPDAERSTALEEWASILRLSGFGFVSLQYGDAAAEIEQLAALGVEVLHDPAIDPLADLDALAAQTAAMDLVISVDNSTAHMAGALGRPVWILLPFVPNWRWRIAGERSHWYPSARLFRQNRAGDWNAVLESVRAALSAADPHAVAGVPATNRDDA